MQKNFLKPAESAWNDTNKDSSFLQYTPIQSKSHKSFDMSMHSSLSKTSLLEDKRKSCNFSSSFSTNELSPLIQKKNPKYLSKGMNLCYEIYPSPLRPKIALPQRTLPRQKTIKINYDFNQINKPSKPYNSYGNIVFKRALYKILLDPLITPNIPKQRSEAKSFSITSEKSVMKSDVEKIMESLEPLRQHKLKIRKFNYINKVI